MVTALSPIIHGDLPIEELRLPQFAGAWKNPVHDEKLRIRKIGRVVFFSGMLVCGETVNQSVFNTALPEGWRPSGSQWFQSASPKGNCLIKLSAGGVLSLLYGSDNAKNNWVPMNGFYYFAEKLTPNQ